MKAAGTVAAAGRINGGPDRRPSYPGEQWIKQANSVTKIWVKVLMGIAYFLCVSVAAFILAVYYAHFWRPDSNNGTAAAAPGHEDPCNRG